MDYRRQVNRRLDEEHRANLGLLSRVEQALARVGAGGPGSAQASELGALAAVFARDLEHDVKRHFDFEERELFPRMVEAGDGDMAALLGEEHDAIRAVSGELLPLLRGAAAGMLDDANWSALKRTALELVERLRAHIEKETTGLLPLLDELLDEDIDRDLAFAYAEG